MEASNEVCRGTMGTDGGRMLKATLPTEPCPRCWGEGTVVVCCDPSQVAGVEDDGGCSAIVACGHCQGTGQVLKLEPAEA